MRKIICSGGEIAYCDDEDYPVVSRHSWVYTKNQKRPYVVTTLNTAEGSKKTIMMHNLIYGFARHVDHKDGNTLNNTKNNLRFASPQQNGWNTGKLKKGHCKRKITSQYKGVSKIKAGWLACIRHSNKVLRIGVYETEVEAAVAYNGHAKRLRGEFAWLNPIPEINHQACTKTSEKP